MTSKKSGFWTFIFSLFPGAGEMYMGFLKQGASLMILFWGIFALTAGFNLSFLMFLLPVVWCYSFFHTHSLRSMPDEEFYAQEDHFLFMESVDDLYTSRKIYDFFHQHRRITAWVLIILGATLLWNSFMDYVYQILPEALYNIIYIFSYNLPQIFLALLFIGLGIYLIKGKKKQLDDDDMDDFFSVDGEEMDFEESNPSESAPMEIQPPTPISLANTEQDSQESEKESDENDKDA